MPNDYSVESFASKDHRPEEAVRGTGRMDGKGAWQQPVVA